MTTYLKDPDSKLDYEFDWASWLGSDTISSYAITVAGVTAVTDSATSTSVTVWVSGGTVGTDATIQCRITTAGGRIDDRTITLKIVQR